MSEAKLIEVVLSGLEESKTVLAKINDIVTLKLTQSA